MSSQTIVYIPAVFHEDTLMSSVRIGGHVDLHIVERGCLRYLPMQPSCIEIGWYETQVDFEISNRSEAIIGGLFINLLQLAFVLTNCFDSVHQTRRRCCEEKGERKESLTT
jgi:hypothetical protein